MGNCQESIGGAHISCPVPNDSFSYNTIVSVPRVCVKTFTFEKEVFDAKLELYKTLSPRNQAVVYTPKSHLCGVLTITPDAAHPLDAAMLNDFKLTKVCARAARQAGRCPLCPRHN